MASSGLQRAITMLRPIALAVALGLAFGPVANAASLDKARALRTNGLRAEAKNELLDFLYEEGVSPEGKAEALLLLGDIALDENNVDAAHQNWTKLVADYPTAPAAETGRTKLEVLDRVARAAPVASPPPPIYAPGTVVVIGPSEYDWAAVQIAGSRGPSAVPMSGSLSDAVKLAAGNSSIAGILQLELDVETVFETGRLTCYRPSGAKSWDKTVRVSSPGGAEHVAHVFVNKLVDRTTSKACP